MRRCHNARPRKRTQLDIDAEKYPTPPGLQAAIYLTFIFGILIFFPQLIGVMIILAAVLVICFLLLRQVWY